RAIHAMTRHARGLTFEQCPAARGIARRHGAAAEIAHGVEIRNHGSELGRTEFVRRHGGAGNALEDYAAQLLVVGGTAELAAAQIDAGYQVAVVTVTGGAADAVEPGADLDVLRADDAGVLLGGRR